MRDEAAARTLATLRFFRNSPQGPEPDATGHRGFYYHFLHMGSGRRAWSCELSTVDTSYLMAGALPAPTYFGGGDPEERRSVSSADFLYRRVDWGWALNRGRTLLARLDPRGRLPALPWTGYSEALLLYLLALGSPTHPISPSSLRGLDGDVPPGERSTGWSSSTRPRSSSTSFPTSGSISGGSATPRCAAAGSTISRTAAGRPYVQQRYAMRNPKGFRLYGEFCWGITACEGPGPPGWSWTVSSAVLRLPGARRAERTGRRDARAVGRDRFAALRSGDRAADDPPLPRARRRRRSAPTASRRRSTRRFRRTQDSPAAGSLPQLRPERWPDHPHDREPSLGAHLGADAATARFSSRPAARGLPGGWLEKRKFVGSRRKTSTR